MIRASTMRQPWPGGSAITGLRSSSTISGTSIGQPRHAQQQLAQRVEVRRRMAAIALQQRQARESVQELVGVAVGQRRDAEPHVAEDLDVDAAQAERDQRAEQRIVGDADHRFDAAGDHRLDQHAVDLARPTPAPRPRGHDVGERATDRGVAAQVQAHGADVGLVQHAARRQLGRDRKAERRAPARPPRPPCARACRRPAAGRTRRARARVSSPVSQPSPRASSAALADRARLVGADVVEAPEQRRRLRAPVGVGRDLRRARARRSPETRRSARARRRRSSGCGRPWLGHHAREHRLAVAPARAAGGDAVANRRRSVSPSDRRIDRREDDEQRVDFVRGQRRPRSRGGIRPARPTRPCRRDCRRSPPAAETRAERAARVGARTADTVRPAASQASTARMPGPPALVTIATRRPAAAAARRGTPRCRTSRRSCRRG